MLKKKTSSPYILKGFGNRMTPQEAAIPYNNGAVSRGNLLLWNDKYFTDPRTWKAGSPFRFIVHTLVNPEKLLSDNSLFLSGGKVLCEWDTISASLISNEKKLPMVASALYLKCLIKISSYHIIRT